MNMKLLGIRFGYYTVIYLVIFFICIFIHLPIYVPVCIVGLVIAYDIYKMWTTPKKIEVVK